MPTQENNMTKGHLGIRVAVAMFIAASWAAVAYASMVEHSSVFEAFADNTLTCEAYMDVGDPIYSWGRGVEIYIFGPNDELLTSGNSYTTVPSHGVHLLMPHELVGPGTYTCYVNYGQWGDYDDYLEQEVRTLTVY
jgi:hypothetical protein